MFSNGDTYYKVLKVADWQLKSALVKSDPVTYPNGTYVETADKTPLLVFGALEYAQAFRKERLEKNPSGHYKICKVKCYGELESAIRVLRLREGTMPTGRD